MNFSLKSLFAIWLLSPQQFHYYFYISVFSWQNQKYSIILILVLCFLGVMPLVCSSYSSFALFSSWWQNDCELCTHILVLQCSPSTSLRQPQTTHVFAESMIALLCHVSADSRITSLFHALACGICVVRAPPKSCPFFQLVHSAFRACYRNRLTLLHHASLP